MTQLTNKRKEKGVLVYNDTIVFFISKASNFIYLSSAFYEKVL